MQEKQNDDTKTIEEDLLGVVTDELTETDLSTDVLDILPSTEVNDTEEKA